MTIALAPNTPPLGALQRLEALRSTLRLLVVVYNVQPFYSAALASVLVARAGLPVIVLWVAKLIVEHIEHHLAGARPIDWPQLGLLVALEFVLASIGEVAVRVQVLLETLLGELCSVRLSREVMRQAARLDLEQLERTATHDHVDRAVGQAGGHVGLVGQAVAVVQGTLTALARWSHHRERHPP